MQKLTTIREYGISAEVAFDLGEDFSGFLGKFRKNSGKTKLGQQQPRPAIFVYKMSLRSNFSRFLRRPLNVEITWLNIPTENWVFIEKQNARFVLYF